MNIKCGHCKSEFSSPEQLQKHMQFCGKKVIEVKAVEIPLYTEPEASGNIYECQNCGASYRSEEGIKIHYSDCY